MLFRTENDENLISHQLDSITIEDTTLPLVYKKYKVPGKINYYKINRYGTIYNINDEIKNKFKTYDEKNPIRVSLIELCKYAKKNKLTIDGTTYDILLRHCSSKFKFLIDKICRMFNVIEYSKESYSMTYMHIYNGNNIIDASVYIMGFHGVGKTYYTDKMSDNNNISIMDINPTSYKWITTSSGRLTEIRNKHYPENLKRDIIRARMMANIVFISSEKTIRDALNSSYTKFILFYPDYSLKSRYIENFQKNSYGNSAFADIMEEVFDTLVKEIDDEIHDPLSLYNMNNNSIYIKLDKDTPYMLDWINKYWMKNGMDGYCYFVDSPIFPCFQSKKK